MKRAQASLFDGLDERAAEVLALAEAEGITVITLFDLGTVRERGPLWLSRCETRQGSRSGPCLDDYGAAVLIGAGRARWHVYDYEAYGGVVSHRMSQLRPIHTWCRRPGKCDWCGEDERALFSRRYDDRLCRGCLRRAEVSA